MDWLILIVAVLVIVVVLQIVIGIYNKYTKVVRVDKQEPIGTKEKKNQYTKKNFLTKNEKDFFLILRELTRYNLIIIPQVNLATVIQKVGEFRFQSELYRNIDFGIFDKNYNLLLLIELNDSTHRMNSRKSRDIKVKDIASQAGIKLITFYTNKPNKQEYVIKRILDELKSK